MIFVTPLNDTAGYGDHDGDDAGDAGETDDDLYSFCRLHFVLLLGPVSCLAPISFPSPALDSWVRCCARGGEASCDLSERSASELTS